MSYGIQAWGADGSPLIRFDDYTARVVEIVEVPAGPFQDRVFANANCVPGETQLVPFLTGINLYIREWYPSVSGGPITPNKPFVEVLDGAFRVNALCNPQPGTMDAFFMYVVRRV